MIAWWLVVSTVAWGGAPRVVQSGDTVESILADLGAPGRVDEVRDRNALKPGDQPAVGTILDLPDDMGEGTCRPSYLSATYGTGTIRVPGQPDRHLAAHVPLPVGTTVCTEADSFARLVLAADLDETSRNAVTILPESCVTMLATHRLVDGRASLVDLDSGALSVEEEPTPGAVIVATDAGLTLGRAGGFRVAVEDSATRTEAIGAAVSTLAQGVEVVLPEGFGGRTMVGEAPGAGVALPAAGEPIAPADGAMLWVPAFSWTPVDVALGYYVEFARDPGFTELVRKARTPEEAWRPRALVLPREIAGLWWRVTSFDRGGFEGAPSTSRRVDIPGGGQ